MCTILSLSESLLVSLVLYVCGHIDLLSKRINEFSMNCQNNQENNSLAPIIKQHQKIMNIVDKIETVYTYGSFLQVFLSTFMMCCAGFMVLTESNDIMILMKYSMVCVTVTWQEYSFCFFGQRLINKSEQISHKVYDTFWYNAKPSEIRAIAYIIKIAQIPLKLTAGKFTSLSAETFTSIMKTSFSYLSVLKATNM
ncbi:odorant receptor 13a-like [Phymastichus coffea]|uniref:odorant receptor 13a-like n=1 Tax=Phymastichus coffea TaxID=108790 RepID=UPI00273B01C9|nr:odorant receptor 13a-like [Phymastichus coffea]